MTVLDPTQEVHPLSPAANQQIVEVVPKTPAIQDAYNFVRRQENTEVPDLPTQVTASDLKLHETASQLRRAEETLEKEASIVTVGAEVDSEADAEGYSEIDGMTEEEASTGMLAQVDKRSKEFMTELQQSDAMKKIIAELSVEVGGVD